MKMMHPIEALSSYLYKYCDHTSTRHLNRKAISKVSRHHNVIIRAPPIEPQDELVISDASDPPPYGEVLPPPEYHSIVGRLCLIDRSDQTFKIYQTDLLMLGREWERRSALKRDVLESVVGGPQMAPQRIALMVNLFMSIVQHQACPRPAGAAPCQCRITRWACLKQEWQDVMFLLGNNC